MNDVLQTKLSHIPPSYVGRFRFKSTFYVRWNIKQDFSENAEFHIGLQISPTLLKFFCTCRWNKSLSGQLIHRR